MKREMTCTLQMAVTRPTELVLQIAVAKVPGLRIKEGLTVVCDGRKKLKAVEVAGPVGTRMHVVQAPVGDISVGYLATVRGQAHPVPVRAAEVSEYLRPSRFVESDKITDTADREFGGTDDPAELLPAVSDWVHNQLSYIAGSSGPTDGAVDTLRSRQGVCRDYAHLTAALLRAKGVAARLVAVYAPGLTPMDFHAVVEANVQNAWHIVDSTRMAPRQSLVRIATGRDAADTAFLSNNGADVTFRDITVTAATSGRPPVDNPQNPVQLR